jgi:hypothetical protein
MGWVVNVKPRPLYPPGKTRYPLYRRLGWPRGRSGRVRKVSPPHTGIRSPDRQARSESLYRLSYPGRSSCPVHEQFNLYHLMYVVVHTDFMERSSSCETNKIFGYLSSPNFRTTEFLSCLYNSLYYYTLLVYMIFPQHCPPRF